MKLLKILAMLSIAGAIFSCADDEESLADIGEFGTNDGSKAISWSIDNNGDELAHNTIISMGGMGYTATITDESEGYITREWVLPTGVHIAKDDGTGNWVEDSNPDYSAQSITVIFDDMDIQEDLILKATYSQPVYALFCMSYGVDEGTVKSTKTGSEVYSIEVPFPLDIAQQDVEPMYEVYTDAELTNLVASSADFDATGETQKVRIDFGASLYFVDASVGRATDFTWASQYSDELSAVGSPAELSFYTTTYAEGVELENETPLTVTGTVARAASGSVSDYGTQSGLVTAVAAQGYDLTSLEIFVNDYTGPVTVDALDYNYIDKSIIIDYDKNTKLDPTTVSTAALSQFQFSVENVDAGYSATLTPSSLEVDSSDASKLICKFTETIYNTDVITLSYEPSATETDCIKTTNGRVLTSFTDLLDPDSSAFDNDAEAYNPDFTTSVSMYLVENAFTDEYFDFDALAAAGASASTNWSCSVTAMSFDYVDDPSGSNNKCLEVDFGSTTGGKWGCNLPIEVPAGKYTISYMVYYDYDSVCVGGTNASATPAVQSAFASAPKSGGTNAGGIMSAVISATGFKGQTIGEVSIRLNTTDGWVAPNTSDLASTYWNVWRDPVGDNHYASFEKSVFTTDGNIGSPEYFGVTQNAAVGKYYYKDFVLTNKETRP